MITDFKEEISIGRSKENDHIITEADISAKHCKITRTNEDQFIIEDLKSTNGTYVNGIRLVKNTTVTTRDQIQLSSSYIVDLKLLFGIYDKPEKVKEETDYIEEFKQLKKVYDYYKTQKKALNDKNRQKQALLRVGIMAIPLLIQITTNVTWFSGISFALAGSLQFFMKNQKLHEDLEDLEVEFRIKYVCPNKSCNQALGFTPWRVWNIQGQCPKCKVQYN